MGAFEYLSVLISIIIALGMTRVLAGVGEMLQARAASDLLGARDLDCKPVCLSRRNLVDFLSLAQSAILDLLPLRFCSHLPNDYVFGLDASFSKGRQRRRID
jgi:hypothetical protein